MARSTESLRSSCIPPPQLAGTRWFRVPRVQASRSLACVSDFTEVADRVWVARYEAYDVNVSVVEGDAGLVVVDTNAADGIGQTLEDLRRLSSRPVVAIVNTHWHFDHVDGNATFRTAYD